MSELKKIFALADTSSWLSPSGDWWHEVVRNKVFVDKVDMVREALVCVGGC